MTAAAGRPTPELRAAYRPRTATTWPAGTTAARAAGVEPLPPGTQSAGGMPDRVKCLHALVAHELAVPGANPLGREALARRGSGGQAARASPGPDGAAGERRREQAMAVVAAWRRSTAARTRSGC